MSHRDAIIASLCYGSFSTFHSHVEVMSQPANFNVIIHSATHVERTLIPSNKCIFIFKYRDTKQLWKVKSN